MLRSGTRNTERVTHLLRANPFRPRSPRNSSSQTSPDTLVPLRSCNPETSDFRNRLVTALLQLLTALPHPAGPCNRDLYDHGSSSLAPSNRHQVQGQKGPMEAAESNPASLISPGVRVQLAGLCSHFTPHQAVPEANSARLLGGFSGQVQTICPETTAPRLHWLKQTGISRWMWVQAEFQALLLGRNRQGTKHGQQDPGGTG